MKLTSLQCECIIKLLDVTCILPYDNILKENQTEIRI